MKVSSLISMVIFLLKKYISKKIRYVSCIFVFTLLNDFNYGGIIAEII